MKTLKMLVMVIIVLVSSVNVMGDLVYTTGTGGEGTVDDAASQAGIIANAQLAYETFTTKGFPREDIWALILSDVDGSRILNGYGYSLGPDYTSFRFRMFGDTSGTRVQASQIIFILNDDDPDLFWVNESTGHLTVGLGDDVVLQQQCVVINGKSPGDISDIYFEAGNQSSDLDSVYLGVPEPATFCLFGIGGLILILRRRR